MRLILIKNINKKLLMKNETIEKKISSKELFGDAKMVLIEHESSVYRLIMTRQGKLILNK